MVYEIQTLDKKLEELYSELFKVGLSLLTKLKQPGQPFYYREFFVPLKETLKELRYDNDPNFIDLAYKINPGLYISRNPEDIRHIASSTVATKIVEDLKRQEYIKCEDAIDLAKQLRTTPEGEKLLEKLKQKLGDFEKAGGVICVSNVDSKYFIEKYGIEPEQYLENLRNSRIPNKTDKPKNNSAFDFVSRLKL